MNFVEYFKNKLKFIQATFIIILRVKLVPTKVDLYGIFLHIVVLLLTIEFYIAAHSNSRFIVIGHCNSQLPILKRKILNSERW